MARERKKSIRNEGPQGMASQNPINVDVTENDNALTEQNPETDQATAGEQNPSSGERDLPNENVEQEDLKLESGEEEIHGPSDSAETGPKNEPEDSEERIEEDAQDELRKALDELHELAGKAQHYADHDLGPLLTRKIRELVNKVRKML